MKITKKNYETIFLAICRRFGIKGFCLKINRYSSNAFLGVINANANSGTLFTDIADNVISSTYLDSLISECPIMFKDGATLSLKDIAYYCRIEDIDEMMVAFTKETMKILCRRTICFNGKIYNKISSIEELLVEVDLIQ